MRWVVHVSASLLGGGRASVTGKPSLHGQDGWLVEQEVRPGLPQAGGVELAQWGDLTPSCLALGQSDGTLA